MGALLETRSGRIIWISIWAPHLFLGLDLGVSKSFSGFLEVLTFCEFSASGCVVMNRTRVIIVACARDVVDGIGADAVLGQTAMQCARE